MASVTINIPNSSWSLSGGGSRIDWNPPNTEHIAMGTDLSADGTPIFFGFLRLPRNTGQQFRIAFSDGSSSEFDAGPELSGQMIQSGTIRIVASDNSEITITGIGDAPEPYYWIPANITDIAAFGNTVEGLADRSLTITFNDNAPQFAMEATAGQPTASLGLTAVPAPVSGISVTVTIPNSDWGTGTTALWQPPANSYVSIGSTLSGDTPQVELFVAFLQFNSSSGEIRVNLANSQTQDDFTAGPEFSDQMEMSGTITYEASDGSILTVTGISDSTEPYQWTPSNSAEVAAFATTLIGLSDRALTVTFAVLPEYVEMEAEAGDPTTAFALTTNAPPEATINTPPQTVDYGATLQLSATVSDPDGGALPAVRWSGPGTFSSTTVINPEWTAPSPETQSHYTLVLTATDAGGLVDRAFLQITVRADPQDLAFSAEAGDPTATFDATAVPAPPLALALSASAGGPTGTFALTAIPAPPLSLGMEAAAGQPTATFGLTAIPPPTQGLAMTARAGDPTARFHIHVAELNPSFAMSARAGDPESTFEFHALNGAIQTVTLAANLNFATGWTGAVLLDSELVSNSLSGYLRSIHISRVIPPNYMVQIGLSRMADDAINDAGPRFNQPLERNPRAIVLSEVGGDTIILPGPNTPGNVSRDSNEPYAYEPGNQASLTSWIAGLGGGLVTARFNDNNVAPVADAGTNQMVSGGDVVTLDGSGSFDPDGSIAHYAWRQISGPTVAVPGDNLVMVTFDAHVSDVEQVYVIQLTVTDNVGKQASDTVQITVAPTATLAMSASAGSPSATFALTSAEPNPRFEMSATAGQPTATFAFASLLAPLRMLACAGSPTAMLNARPRISAAPMPLPQWAQDLSDDRWAWSWKGYRAMHVLVDAFVEQLAARQGAVFNDYDNLDPSALPFKAFELDAIGWEAGGTIPAQRNALKRADELNNLIGSEAAYYILLEINRCTGYHRYRPDGAKTRVDLAIAYSAGAVTPAAIGDLQFGGNTVSLIPYPAQVADIDTWAAATILELYDDSRTTYYGHVQIASTPTTDANGVVSFEVLNPDGIAFPTGAVDFTYHSPYTGVELYITAPIDRAFDTDFLLYITDRATKVWPFTLDVIAVHVLTASQGNVYVQSAQYSQVFSGWPGGV